MHKDLGLMKRSVAQKFDPDPDPSMSLEIGELRLGSKLRHARLVHGMRLSDVAEKSGCSDSLISKIENNKAMPSLNTLHRLAKALGTTISDLFREGAGGNGVVTRQGERLILSGMRERGDTTEGIENELLIPFGANTLLQASIVRVDAGGRSDGLHQHQGDEAGYVLRGEVVLTVGADTYRLGPGDAFFYSSAQPHGISNPGTTRAEIVWVNTPPSL
jgi:transcriptional regulator with XRE-family HTH domain